jgi:hypothetical protein
MQPEPASWYANPHRSNARSSALQDRKFRPAALLQCMEKRPGGTGALDVAMELLRPYDPLGLISM